MTNGEREIWAAVFAASYVAHTSNALMGSQPDRDAAVNHAASVATDALSGLGRAVELNALPAGVRYCATKLLKRVKP